MPKYRALFGHVFHEITSAVRLVGHSAYLNVPAPPEWQLVKVPYLDMSQHRASLVAN